MCKILLYACKTVQTLLRCLIQQRQILVYSVCISVPILRVITVLILHKYTLMYLICINILNNQISLLFSIFYAENGMVYIVLDMRVIRIIIYFSWQNRMLWVLINVVSVRRLYLSPTSWAATGESVPSEMCAQRRLMSAYASAQSDQILRCPHEQTLHPSLSNNKKKNKKQKKRNHSIEKIYGWVFVYMKTGHWFIQNRCIAMQTNCILEKRMHFACYWFRVLPCNYKFY